MDAITLDPRTEPGLLDRLADQIESANRS